MKYTKVKTISKHWTNRSDPINYTRTLMYTSDSHPHAKWQYDITFINIFTNHEKDYRAKSDFCAYAALFLFFKVGTVIFFIRKCVLQIFVCNSHLYITGSTISNMTVTRFTGRQYSGEGQHSGFWNKTRSHVWAESYVYCTCLLWSIETASSKLQHTDNVMM